MWNRPRFDDRTKVIAANRYRYWVAILTASTLGTTLGDFVSGDLDLGLRLASLVLGALLAISVAFELIAQLPASRLPGWPSCVRHRRHSHGRLLDE